MKKHQFTIVIEKDVDGGFVASVVELPGCYSQGDTQIELMRNIKEAIELHLEMLHEPQNPVFQTRFVATAKVTTRP